MGKVKKVTTAITIGELRQLIAPIPDATTVKICVMVDGEVWSSTDPLTVEYSERTRSVEIVAEGEFEEDSGSRLPD